MKEGEVWYEIERVKSKSRQGTRTDIVPNLAPSNSGKTRDKVAEKVRYGQKKTPHKRLVLIARHWICMQTVPAFPTCERQYKYSEVYELYKSYTKK